MPQVVPTARKNSASTDTLIFTCLADGIDSCADSMHSLCCSGSVSRVVIACPPSATAQLEAVLSAASSTGVQRCVVMHTGELLPQAGGSNSLRIVPYENLPDRQPLAVEDAARALVSASHVASSVLPEGIVQLAVSDSDEAEEQNLEEQVELVAHDCQCIKWSQMLSP